MRLKDSDVSMVMDIKFNRPIRQEDIVVPGGYAIKSGNKVIEFDFCNVILDINSKDPSIGHFEATSLDFDSFPELAELNSDILSKVSSIPEFFVFTGEATETDLKPIKLLSCGFSTIEELIDLPKYICKAVTITCNI